MTLTSEQIEQIQVERLKQDIETREMPYFGTGGGSAPQSIDIEDDFVQRKVEVSKPVSEQQVPDKGDAAESQLTPDEQDEQLALQALKSMAAEDRAALSFVQRHKADYHATPENGAKLLGFLNQTGTDINAENLEWAFSELAKQGEYLGKPKKKISGLPSIMSHREPEPQDDYEALGEEMRAAPDLGTAKEILLAAMRRQRQRTEAAGWTL